MAEVLGVVSGVVGITAFVAQVAEKIEALRATYNYNQTEAKPAIESLLLRLGALHSQLQTLQKLEGHQPVRIEILSCQASYVSIDLGLQKLLEKFSGMKNAKLKGSKSVKIGSLRDIRSDIENLESKINTMSITMIVYVEHPRVRSSDNVTHHQVIDHYYYYALCEVKRWLDQVASGKPTNCLSIRLNQQ